ncbi:MAG: OmpA family protein [Alphaproteobacteria bacterium]|nr:OmpA family protein [Alphaproteobacteria bacterium]
MKLVNKIAALAAIVLVAACGIRSSSTVEALNNAQAVGAPFTKNLAAEYRDFANYAQNEAMDFADALHFARKGLASASGVVVMPETLDDWDLGDANLIEMTTARNDLVDALENGGRETAPEKAAIAQARFDCWAEQQEEDWKANVPCKGLFHDALKDLQSVVGAQPEPEPEPAPVAEEFPAPVTEMPKGEPAPVEQAMFIVFFDWDKFNLSSSANEVLDAVAQELRKRTDVNGVVIAGHTDTSGASAYNQKLSMKRAGAVRDALIARGVEKATVRVEAHGENDLLVKTADDVREPANRRAQITLE